MYRIVNFKNGATLITNKMSHFTSIAIGIWIRRGSRNEEKRLSGISHFLEHMVFKGTKKRNTRQIKEAIEGRGGSLNAFTSEEVTSYLAKLSGRHAHIALDVLSDMVLHAKLEETDIERERTVITEEIKMYRDLPNQYVHDILSELMWPDHPLGMPVAGDTPSIKSIAKKDLISYKNTNYTPKNISVILCGDLKHSHIASKVKRILSLKTGPDKGDFCKFTNKQSSPCARFLYKDTEQSHVAMGLHAFGREHKDRYILSLLHIILGANMSSRLFENVREKRGLAYEIGTQVKRYIETGAFVVSAGIEHKKVSEAVGVIVKELKKIKKFPVSKDELRRAKEYFKVQLALSLEDTLEHMLWLGHHTLFSKKLPSRDAIIKKVERITLDELRRVAKIVFDKKNLNLAIIGPTKEKEKKIVESELGL